MAKKRATKATRKKASAKRPPPRRGPAGKFCLHVPKGVRLIKPNDWNPMPDAQDDEWGDPDTCPTPDMND